MLSQSESCHFSTISKEYNIFEIVNFPRPFKEYKYSLHSFSKDNGEITAEKNSFHYSDEHKNQNLQTQTKSEFLTLTQSEFLNFEFLVHESNEKSVCPH